MHKKMFAAWFRTTDEFINCKIIAAPGKYDFKPFAFGYQKNSPFAEMFDYHIEKIRQTGVLDTIKTKYQGLEQKCPDLRLVVALFSEIYILDTFIFSVANHYLSALYSLLLELFS